MAKNRYINTKFWDDSYISDLGPNAKLLYLYFLTNALTNICGVYEISLKRMVFDTGISEQQITLLLKRFNDDNKIFFVDGYIIIKNFIKYQKDNESIKKGISEELKKVPSHILEIANIDGSKALLVLNQRQAIAVRDRFICSYCNKEINEDKDLEIDYIHPESRGGKPNYLNLTTSCSGCNRKKGDKTAHEFGYPDIKPRNYHANIATKELKENGDLLKKFIDVFKRDVIVDSDYLIEVRRTGEDTEGHHLNMNLNSNSNSNSNIKELGNSVKDKKDKTTSRKIINKIKKDLKIKGVIK